MLEFTREFFPNPVSGLKYGEANTNQEVRKSRKKIKKKIKTSTDAQNVNAEEEEDDEGIIGTKETNKSEGEKLYHRKEYRKAKDCFTMALDTDPKRPDPRCLVWRARCHLKLGDEAKALEDSEASLNTNANFIHGLLIKARTLYEIGDFEFALVNFHRGHRLRPELEEFSEGVQCCEEIITNCVGNPEHKITLDGDLSFLDKVHPQISFMTEEEKKSKEKVHRDDGHNSDKNRRPTAVHHDRGKNVNANNVDGKVDAKLNNNVNCGMCTHPKEKAVVKDRFAIRVWKQPKTCKKLLGDLYGDRLYLESLLTDGDLIEPTYPVGLECKKEISDAINYLDSTADFWQKYLPIYSRLENVKGSQTKKLMGEDLAKQIQGALEDIDLADQESRYEESLSKARLLLASSAKWNPLEITNKRIIISALRNYMGVAYMELGRLERGLREHTVDLDECLKPPVLIDNKSRALENMGKIYAKLENYDKALQCWRKKEPLCKTNYERMWVSHEMGRAYFETGNYLTSKSYGEKSYETATMMKDKHWQLHAIVLKAQSEAKLGEYDGALESFAVSLQIAEESGEELAVEAIQKAMNNIKLRRARMLKRNQPRRRNMGEEGEEGEARLVSVGQHQSDGAVTDSDDAENRRSGRDSRNRKSRKRSRSKSGSVVFKETSRMASSEEADDEAGYDSDDFK